MALTALWWWIDRWRKSTAYTDMTLAEQGAYRNLLDEATLRGGPLPTDERVLAKACGDPTKWKRVRHKVMSHFYQAPDGWRNETLDSVLARSEELRVARAASGRQGGLAKASKHPSKPLANEVANTLANGVAKTWHPSPSPSPDKEHPTPSGVGPRARPGRIVQRRRKDAAFEYGRLYVPQRAHDDLMMLGNHGSVEKALFDWYEAICEEYTNGAKVNTALPTDLIAFWKHKYAERWPADEVPSLNAKQPAWIAAARAKS